MIRFHCLFFLILSTVAAHRGSSRGRLVSIIYDWSFMLYGNNRVDVDTEGEKSEIDINYPFIN